jgi:outer membrane murein-binding lipoprotein Lpp
MQASFFERVETRTMNALQTRINPETIARDRVRNQNRSKPKQKSSRRSSRYQGKAAELTLKLVFNSVLCVAGVAAIVKLLPYHFLQEAKLQEVSTEVKETQKRVDRLNQDLSHNSDLQQTNNLRQEYSHRVAPDRRPVIWLESQPQP